MKGSEKRRAARRVMPLLACLGLVACMHGQNGSQEPLPRQPEPAADPTGTAAVSEVDGDDVQGIPVTRLEELIEGRVAGVQVMRLANGGISIRIRGPSSINGSNEPLYIVDGMPVYVAPGEGLDWMNPGDIHSIRVLKDAAATAMYGMRGANGVVVITTRRARQES